MVDLHKEIKLSDLFKRGPKEPGEPKAEKPSKEPKKPKEPKRRKEPREKAGVLAEREAPPVLGIPLMRSFNLMPREEPRPTKERESPLPHILVALAGVLVFAASAALYLSSGADVTKKQSQVEDLRAELAAYQAPAPQKSLDAKAAALTQERAGRTTALGTALTKRLAWDRLLREVALVIPRNVTLDTVTGLSPGSPGAAAAVDGTVPKAITITGHTDDEADVAEFMSRLSVIPELGAVQLQSAAVSNDDPNEVVFTINGSLRGAA
ncbi:MAG TPA: PilN domain-containing protein [Gaiellaceae bacterium]|jgi:Tfp pilus assembly protein PilN